MKYTKEKLEEAVSKSETIAGVLRYFNTKISGGNYSHVSKAIKKYNIDNSHFKGQAHAKGKKLGPKRSADDILILRDNDRRQHAKILRRALLERGVEYKCFSCNISSWMGKIITLDIDHINENWLDDREENLRFLCPNCHRNKHREVVELADTAGLDPAAINRQLRVRVSPSLLTNECLECNKKCSHNAKRCKSCEGVRRNIGKTKRPPKEQLEIDLKVGNMCAIGRKYGVSDNAVRKWVKFYSL